VLIGVLAVTLTGCGARTVTLSGSSVSAPAGSAPTEPDTAPSPSGDQGFAFPDLPQILIPDVTSFTEGSQQYAEKLGSVAAPGAGVSVAGARCDTRGQVINNATMTLTDHGDGSGVYDDAYRRIEIKADGSGFYDDAYVRINVNADGSGDLDDAYKAIKVAADGFGSYHDGYLDVTVAADGSGRYEDAYTTVTSNGDGTGTVDGEPAKVAPFPRFKPVGRFPPVKALRPLGKSCGTLIRLEDRVLFDFDQATLRSEAGSVLDKVAAALTGLTVPLQVNGHTDAQGSDSYNLDLSWRRAQAVADALATRGVDTDLTVQGFGETRPVAPNEVDGSDNPSGRQQNRRVEIVIPN
jgi:OmpA-OmpF porin, OOP family